MPLIEELNDDGTPIANASRALSNTHSMKKATSNIKIDTSKASPSSPLLSSESPSSSTVDAADLLLPDEAERLVETLRPFDDIGAIGSHDWMVQRETIEKLNMQACICASNQADEYIMTAFTVVGRVKVLIHELMCVEVWREKVFPELCKLDLPGEATMAPYLVLYHEATLCNLLEILIYHEEACEEAGDSMLDLLAYCYRRVVNMWDMEAPDEANTDKSKNQSAQELLAVTPVQTLQQQMKKLLFDCSLKMLSVVRYITDHHASMPLSVASRLMKENDMITGLIPILDGKPWAVRKPRGVTAKYIDGKWIDMKGAEAMKLTQTEGQVWLSLYNLLMDGDLRVKYDLNRHNKESVLKLRKHFNELLIDQLPVLGLLQRCIEELAITEAPEPKRDLLMTQEPEVRTKLLEKYRGKWASIAKTQLAKVFTKSHEERVAEAKRMVALYNLEDLVDAASKQVR